MSLYNTVLEDILNSHAPVKSMSVAVRQDVNPWINEDIKQAKRERRSLSYGGGNMV